MNDGGTIMPVHNVEQQHQNTINVTAIVWISYRGDGVVAMMVDEEEKNCAAAAR